LLFGHFFREDPTMTGAERESYRRQLQALWDRLTGEVSHLAEEARGDGGSDLSHVPLHMADLGSDSFEHDNTMSLLAKEKQLLEEIPQAMQRLDKGDFGRCEVCQQSIPRERLKELPFTRYCVTCARKAESQRS
jgi:RNA polymerase-binding transcription factor DksA